MLEATKEQYWGMFPFFMQLLKSVIYALSGNIVLERETQNYTFCSSFGYYCGFYWERMMAFIEQGEYKFRENMGHLWYNCICRLSEMSLQMLSCIVSKAELRIQL